MFDVAAIAPLAAWEPASAAMGAPSPKPDAAIGRAGALDAFAAENLGNRNDQLLSLLSKDGELTFKEMLWAAELGSQRLAYMNLLHTCSTTLRDGILTLSRN
jgi:hypothetical protein